MLLVRLAYPGSTDQSLDCLSFVESLAPPFTYYIVEVSILTISSQAWTLTLGIVLSSVPKCGPRHTEPWEGFPEETI